MTDQERFDANVDKAGKVVLQVLAGLGIFGAVMMSAVALMRSGNTSSPTVVAAAPAAAKAAPSAPKSVNAMIDHVLRGCHAWAINGGAPSPSATIHLAVGGRLNVQDNDVMPHKLVLVSGPGATFAGAAMNHMGAKSTVTFPTAGTYRLTTKPGEDYTKGITTIGPDNVLRMKVIVTS